MSKYKHLERYYIRKNKNVQVYLQYFSTCDDKPVSAFVTFANGHCKNFKIERFNNEFTSMKLVLDEVKPNSLWTRLSDGLPVFVLKLDTRKGVVVYRRNEKPYSDYFETPMVNFLDKFEKLEADQ